MVEGVHHAALAVSDIPRAVSFYEEVLGFSPIGPDNPENTIETADYFWIDIGGGEWINLAVRPDVTPNYPGKKDDPHGGNFLELTHWNGPDTQDCVSTDFRRKVSA